MLSVSPVSHVPLWTREGPAVSEMLGWWWVKLFLRRKEWDTDLGQT